MSGASEALAATAGPTGPAGEPGVAHTALAAVVIALGASVVYLRRPCLLLLAALVAGGGRSEWPAVVEVIQAGAGAALILAGELLVWTALPGLRRLTASGGIACSLFGVIVLVHASELTAPAAAVAAIVMVLLLPWFAAASSWRLHSVPDREGAREHLASVVLTRSLLEDCANEQARGPGTIARVPAEPPGRAEAQARAAIARMPLIERLHELHARVGRLGMEEHQAMRAAILTARGLAGVGLLDEAAERLERALEFPVPASDSPPPEAGSRALPLVVEHAVRTIRAYRALIPIRHRPGCRMEPSCSVYAEGALLRHGASRGLRLALDRALRCVPYGDAGFDPVPAIGHRWVADSSVARAALGSAATDNKESERERKVPVQD